MAFLLLYGKIIMGSCFRPQMWACGYIQACFHPAPELLRPTEAHGSHSHQASHLFKGSSVVGQQLWEPLHVNPSPKSSSPLLPRVSSVLRLLHLLYLHVVLCLTTALQQSREGSLFKKKLYSNNYLNTKSNMYIKYKQCKIYIHNQSCCTILPLLYKSPLPTLS